MIDKSSRCPRLSKCSSSTTVRPTAPQRSSKSASKEFPATLHLLERSGKQGLGTAYLTGFRWGLDNGFDYICEMDCDFSHNPDDLVRLYQLRPKGTTWWSVRVTCRA